MHYHLFLIFLLNTFFSFNVNGRDFSVVEDTSKQSCLQSATRKLDEVLLLMQKHYYKKQVIPWDSLKSAAKARLLISETCEDAYETVSWCFKQIRETHSFIMPSDKAAVYNYDTAYLKKKPSISRLVGEIRGELLADKGIAYLTVPWIATTDPAICTKIADSLQGLIANLDRNGISKWIIDVRKNTGGNCWPMLAGLGPLLDNGICGYFVSETEKIPISYNNGAALQGRNIRCQVTNNGYQTKVAKKLIVVLTGPNTSSSGEIITLAFKGKEGTYQYGEPTAGLTTANSTYTLSDQSILVLTVCREADRSGKVYDGKIIPDEMIALPANTNDDAAKSAAVMWLHIQ